MFFSQRGVILTPLCFLLLFSLFAAAADVPDKTKRFMEAAENGDLAAVKSSIKAGVPVDARDWDGATALIRATQHGQTQVVGFLIERGTNLNATEDPNGASALMFAVRKSDNYKGKRTAPIESKFEIARTLIRSGADINLKNKWGATAIQWGIDAENVPIVNELIAAGADVNIADLSGLTPLMVAANYEGENYLAIVKSLVKAKADVNAADLLGQTALMKACMNHYKTATIEFLIESGANVNAKTKDGFTPLMMACRTARVEIIKFLIDHGADAKARTEDGRSVFQIAKESGYTASVQALKDKGITE